MEYLNTNKIDTYLGLPEEFEANSGEKLAAEEFKQLTTSTGVAVKLVIVELHSSIDFIERY